MNIQKIKHKGFTIEFFKHHPFPITAPSKTCYYSRIQYEDTFVLFRTRREALSDAAERIDLAMS